MVISIPKMSFGFSAVPPPYFVASSAIALALSPEIRRNFFCAFISVMVSPVLPSTIMVIFGVASIRILLPLSLRIISLAEPFPSTFCTMVKSARAERQSPATRATETKAAFMRTT